VDDLVQETFVSAASNVSRFDAQIASVWTWLLGIARRRIADYYRANGKDPLLNPVTRRLVSNLADIEGAMASGAPLPDEVCETEEFRLVVRAALNSLEPRHQACLLARYYQDLSLDEVGQLMNLSPSAANSMLHRARGRLHRAIKRLVGGKANHEDFTP
jgi:RNA polymerase sigma-70 factor (ECF subfamily)